MVYFAPIFSEDPKKTRFIWKYTDERWPRQVLNILAKEVSKAKRKGKSYVTGWKKVRALEGSSSYIAELRIPVNAQMRCPRNRKCRASRVKVVALYRISGRTLDERLPPDTIAGPYNKTTRNTRYKAGVWVKPEYKFEKNNSECASGIHFFLTVEKAINWC